MTVRKQLELTIRDSWLSDAPTDRTKESRFHDGAGLRSPARNRTDKIGIVAGERKAWTKSQRPKWGYAGREREAQRDVLLKETSTEKTINKECFHINLFIDLLKRKGKNKLREADRKLYIFLQVKQKID